jgi:hypothetical protein
MFWVIISLKNLTYFQNLAKDIEYSRIFLGVHYPSDNDFSLYIVDTIIKDKEFKAKYGL